MVCLRAYPPCQFGQLARIGAIAPSYDDHHIHPARHVHGGVLALLRRRANGVQHLRMLYALANAFAQRLIVPLDGRRRLRKRSRASLHSGKAFASLIVATATPLPSLPAQDYPCPPPDALAPPRSVEGIPSWGRGEKPAPLNALNVPAGGVHNRGPARCAVRRMTAASHAMGANHNSRPGWIFLFCARGTTPFRANVLHHMRIVDDGTQAMLPEPAGQRAVPLPGARHSRSRHARKPQRS